MMVVYMLSLVNEKQGMFLFQVLLVAATCGMRGQRKKIMVGVSIVSPVLGRLGRCQPSVIASLYVYFVI